MGLRVSVLASLACCGLLLAITSLGSRVGVRGVAWRSALVGTSERLGELTVASLNVRYAARVAPGSSKPGRERPWAERRDALGALMDSVRIEADDHSESSPLDSSQHHRLSGAALRLCFTP